TILEEAHGLIHGDRNQAYGHPLDDFTCTARLWSAWLQHKYNELGHDIPDLEAVDVPWLMSLLKHSRQANSEKRDNLVDAVGYLGTVEMVEEEVEKRRTA